MYSRRDPDFNWLTDDSVILEPRRAMAIYLNQRGEVVLRQQRDWDEDDDTWIVFPHNDAEMVAARILDLIRDPANFRNAPRHCTLSERAEPPAEPKQTEAPPAASDETLLDRMGDGGRE